MEPNIYNPYVAAIFKNKTLRKWAKLEPDEMAFSKALSAGKLVVAEFKDIKITYKDFLLPGIPELLITRRSWRAISWKDSFEVISSLY